MNTDQWRDVDDFVQSAFDASDDADIAHEEAACGHHIELHLGIDRKLYSRRQQSDTRIRRHDESVQLLNVRSEKEN